MKRGMVILSATFLVLSIARPGDRKDIKWLSMNAGLEQAKKSNKKMVIDVYTDWCGWCKKMDKAAYANEEVVAYLGEKYVTVRLNAESREKVTYKGEENSEMSLARAFGVTGYPTTIFLEPGGDGIASIPGYHDAPSLLNILKYIGEDYYKSMKWAEYLSKKTKKD